MPQNAVTLPSDNKKAYTFEVLLLSFVFLVTIAGIIICFADKRWFEEVYTAEDGFIENFTLFPLSIAFVVALRYLVKLSKYKSRMFIICMAGAALFSFFVAGEEISWGQRIFKTQVPAYFIEHNAQQETNIHNLLVGGKKVNKIVFTWLLSVVTGFYLLVLPVLYGKNAGVKRFIDWAGIPIPRTLHIVSAVILFVLLALIRSSKNSEILEMGISSVFLLILMYPQNRAAFRTAD